MFLRNSKKLSLLLLLVWVAWFGTATVCLANNHHACCPTQSADWHMDTVHSTGQAIRWQLSDVIFTSVNLLLMSKIETNSINYHLLASFKDISPPYFLLSKVNNLTNAPPQA